MGGIVEAGVGALGGFIVGDIVWAMIAIVSGAANSMGVLADINSNLIQAYVVSGIPFGLFAALFGLFGGLRWG